MQKSTLKKEMKKKILIGLAVVVLLLAMAVPTMAGGPVKPPAGEHFTFNAVTEWGPFMDTFDGDLSLWTNLSGSGAIVDDAGEKVYQHTGGLYVGAVTALAGSASWTDYTFEVDVKKISGTYFNLVFRYVDPGNFYMVEGGSSGGTQIKLYKRVGGAFTLISAVNQPTLNGQWYHYVIQVEGTSIKVWLDAGLKFDVVDSAHSAGKIGIGGYDSTVYFDNVLVVGPTVKVMGPNEILVPLNGSGWLGAVAGPTFEILDNDMTDGQAWVQVPPGSYAGWDQARGKPGGELTFGDHHVRATGKPKWTLHATFTMPGAAGNWLFTNDGVTCYSYRFYLLP